MIDSILTFTHCLQFVNHNNYSTWQRTFIYNLYDRMDIGYLNVAMINLFDTRFLFQVIKHFNNNEFELVLFVLSKVAENQHVRGRGWF